MKIAVLSDIHANLPALEAVLGSLGTVDAVWHLGDVVGYGAEPDAVVERLREIGAIGVKGNHDDAASGGDSILDFNPTARDAARWTRSHMSDETRRYLSGLPVTLTPSVGDDAGAFTLVHGSPRDPIVEYVISPEVARANLGVFTTQYCLIGHTHVPVGFLEEGERGRMVTIDADPGAHLRLDGRRMLINPGSVGQPRDGNPNASYLVLDAAAMAVTWHRVAYDIERAKRRIVDAGLPGQLARRLDLGR